MSQERAEKPRILVVEDDPVIGDLLNCVLRDEGYEVSTATTVDEAILAIKRGPKPNAALVDVEIPGGEGDISGGGALVRRLRFGESPLDPKREIKVGLITAGSFELVFSQDPQLRGLVDDSVPKPFQSIEGLLGTVSRLIQAHP